MSSFLNVKGITQIRKRAKVNKQVKVELNTQSKTENKYAQLK